MKLENSAVSINTTAIQVYLNPLPLTDEAIKPNASGNREILIVPAVSISINNFNVGINAKLNHSIML